MLCATVIYIAAAHNGFADSLCGILNRARSVTLITHSFSERWLTNMSVRFFSLTLLVLFNIL